MASNIVKSGAKAIGGAVRDVVKGTARKASEVAKKTADKATSKAEVAIKDTHGPSPNRMTNLIIADVALRGGGRLLRHVVERALLGVKYDSDKARDIVKSRSMTQSLLGTAVARVATRSVPGALLVGGGLLAKTLYDRSKDRKKAEAEGDQAIDDQTKSA